MTKEQIQNKIMKVRTQEYLKNAGLNALLFVIISSLFDLIDGSEIEPIPLLVKSIGFGLLMGIFIVKNRDKRL